MIVFNIDVMLARRKMSLTELSERVGITMANLSILKTGKAKAVRVETLNKLCHALDCQPGDLPVCHHILLASCSGSAVKAPAVRNTCRRPAYICCFFNKYRSGSDPSV